MSTSFEILKDGEYDLLVKDYLPNQTDSYTIKLQPLTDPSQATEHRIDSSAEERSNENRHHGTTVLSKNQLSKGEYELQIDFSSDTEAVLEWNSLQSAETAHAL